MFERLGRCIARHPGKVILAWCIPGLLLAIIAPDWDQRTQDDDLRSLPAHCLSSEGYQLLRKAFPREVSGSKAIFAFERQNGPLTPADLELVDRSVAALVALRRSQPELHVGAVASYSDPLLGLKLLSADQRCTLVSVSLETPFLALKTADAVKRLERVIRPLQEAHGQTAGSASDELRVVTTGTSGMGRDLNEGAYRSIEDTTIATLVLVVVILLTVYRAPLLALVPLATIGASVWISLRVLALLTLLPDVQLASITRVFVVVVLYGAGTDYCLFLISRYREELWRGLTPASAVHASLGRVGWALTASAGTVVCGLGMMGFAEFAKLRCTGPAIAISLVIALLASLTLAPALLRMLGSWAFWPGSVSAQVSGSRRRRHAPRDEPDRRDCSAAVRFWTWLSERVAAYPGRIWLGTVLTLLPLAILGWCTRSTNHISSELPHDSQGRVGLDVICRHFNPGEIGPLTVLLEGAGDWQTPVGRDLIARLTAELSKLDNVAEVRSLTQPLGPLPVRVDSARGGPGALLASMVEPVMERLASERYVAALPTGQVARVEVVFRTEPFAEASHAAMLAVRGHLQRWNEPGLRAVLFGITTVSHDVTALQASDRTLVNSLVLACVLLILAALVRRPGVAVYLLSSVLFSYYVAVGAAELLAYGWIDSHLGEIDWKVPFFLFTILVAIGQDCNIFLVTRVQEETRRHGQRRGIQRALACTGGTISACGLIMAGTFATLMLGQLPTLIQLGLALAIGVLLDTFVVRAILVPAFLLMLEGVTRPVQRRVSAPELLRGSLLQLPRLTSAELEREGESTGLAST